MQTEKDLKTAAEKCLQESGLDPDSYRIGHTKVRILTQFREGSKERSTMSGKKNKISLSICGRRSSSEPVCWVNSRKFVTSVWAKSFRGCRVGCEVTLAGNYTEKWADKGEYF